MKDGVALYGGFAATETLRTQRDWGTHVTVLSGDLDGNDVTDTNGVVTSTDNITGDNAYHVVNGSGVTETAKLDGFSITAGKADGSDSLYRGGGMHNKSGSPALTNVTFSGNSAGLGGGMYNKSSDPTLTNVIFSGNSAEYGGGMFSNGSDPMLTDVTFSDSSAYNGGGMYNDGYSNPTLTNVTFSSNTANYEGGGMVNNYGSSPTMTNTTFTGNSASFGGGMKNWNQSNPTLINVTFSGNFANLRGGGMSNGYYSSPTLINVTFSGNVADYGGGMRNYYYSNPTLTNVTFGGNVADDRGGGMYNSPYHKQSNPTLVNCILWGNSASDRGDQIYNDSTTPVISYTLIQDSGGSGVGWDTALGTDGGGNIDADPQFLRDPDPGDGDWTTPADNDYGDLRLGLNSPAIDAGDNTALPSGVTTDLGGSPRRFDVPFIADTGNGTVPIVDMGAYEAPWQQQHQILLPLVLRGSN